MVVRPLQRDRREPLEPEEALIDLPDTEEEYPLSVSHHQASARGRQAVLEQETGDFRYWEET